MRSSCQDTSSPRRTRKPWLSASEKWLRALKEFANSSPSKKDFRFVLPALNIHETVRTGRAWLGARRVVFRAGDLFLPYARNAGCPPCAILKQLCRHGTENAEAVGCLRSRTLV